MIRQPRRSIADIKTRGRGLGPRSESSARHDVYLKMAMLEIERDRRAKEQVAASARASRIQERLQQIDAEVRSLKEITGDVAIEPEAPAAEPAQVPPVPFFRRRVFRF